MKRVTKPAVGYAYIEVLIAAIILVTAIVPATEALGTLSEHAAARRALIQTQYDAIGRMETVLAQPFDALQSEAQATGGLTPSSFSDPNGTPNALTVMLAPHDIDNADGDDDPLTGVDTDVIQITVSAAMHGVQFRTLLGPA